MCIDARTHVPAQQVEKRAVLPAEQQGGEEATSAGRLSQGSSEQLRARVASRVPTPSAVEVVRIYDKYLLPGTSSASQYFLLRVLFANCSRTVRELKLGTLPDLIFPFANSVQS
jgi:hypothetical protein